VRAAVALALAAAVLAGAAGCGAGEPIRREPGQNAVVRWHAEAERAILRSGHQPPWESPLTFALVDDAMYDAVTAVERRHRPFLVAARARGDEPLEAVVAGAAHGVLTALVPGRRPALDAALERSTAGLDRERARRGVALGARVARGSLAARRADGRDGAGAAVPAAASGPPGSGRWVPTPPDRAPFASRWVGDVRPFVLDDPAQLRSPGPPRPGSAASRRQYDEVVRLGARTGSARTAEQTATARFWSNDMMASWAPLLRSLTAARRLGVADAARMHAMASTAAADGAIACWNDKAHYAFWRPVTAARAAGLRGWTPLLDTPPFPEHPSGHACIGAALAGATAQALGTDRVSFALRSPATGDVRRYTRLSQVVDEVGMARIYAGAHFRSASTQGAAIGRGVVARLTAGGHFAPVQGPASPSAHGA
jgi:hypothetical protein